MINMSKKVSLITVAVMLVIVVLGAILFGVCKYNYGADIKGSVEITIELDENAKQTSVAQKYSEDIASILKKDGFKFAKASRQATAESAFKTLVYNVKIDKSANKTIQKLNGKFKADLENYFQKQYDGTPYDFDFDSYVQINKVGGNYYKDFVLKTFLAVLVVALAVAVYFIIRYGFASGFATLISLVLDLATFLALIAIIRLKVNGYFVTIIPICAIYSALLSLIAFAHLKKEFGKKLDRAFIPEKSIISHAVTSKAICYMGIGFAVLLLALLCILPVEFKFVMLYLIFAVGVCTADSILLKPTVRLLLSKIKKEKVTGYAKITGQARKEDK